jgi:hypothetical protein
VHTHTYTHTYNTTQVYGEKKWLLFAPTDTECMYATRLPYEESSVFSAVNVERPDLLVHPLFAKVECVCVCACVCGCHTDCMNVTRLPYGESSVFSAVNVERPDLLVHSRFAKVEIVRERGRACVCVVVSWTA